MRSLRLVVAALWVLGQPLAAEAAEPERAADDTVALLRAAAEIAKEGRLAEAVAQVERAIATASDVTARSSARLTLASLLVESSTFELEPGPLLERALELYESSLPEAPEELRLTGGNNLGGLYLRLGRVEDALAQFDGLEQEMLTSDVATGTRVAFFFNHGRAREKYGLVDEAFSSYARAASLDPDFKEAAGAALRIATTTAAGAKPLRSVVELLESAIAQHRWSDIERYLKGALGRSEWHDDRHYPGLLDVLVRYLADAGFYPEDFNQRWRDFLASLLQTAPPETGRRLREILQAYEEAYDVGLGGAAARHAFPSWFQTENGRRLFSRLLGVVGAGYRHAGDDRAALERYAFALGLNPGDPQLAFDLVDVIYRSAELDPEGAVLGRLAQGVAAESFLASFTSRELGVAPLTPRLREWQTVARFHQVLGDALKKCGKAPWQPIENPSSPLQQWQLALNIHERLQYSVPQTRRTMARLHGKRGDGFESIDLPRQALVEYRQAQALAGQSGLPELALELGRRAEALERDRGPATNPPTGMRCTAAGLVEEGSTSGGSFLRGCVVDEAGDPLPGVLVIASTSEGQRSAITDATGEYVLRFLPAGDTVLRFKLEGFTSQEHKAELGALRTYRMNVAIDSEVTNDELLITAVPVEIWIPTDPAVTSSIRGDTLDSLASGRDLAAAAELAPGVQDNATILGCGSALSISGGTSFDNLILVDGARVNDEQRDHSMDLFVNDAIEETTVLVAGIPAEYGRFTGGVISAITGSGGNDFGGSLRFSLDNQAWESATALTAEREDDVGHSVEAVFRGPLWKDRLWFFLAGQNSDQRRRDTLPYSGLVTSGGLEDQRFEAKLTAAVSPNHVLTSRFLSRRPRLLNSHFGVVDAAGLSDREDPQKLTEGQYTGVLTSSVLLEMSFTRRRFTLAEGRGAPTTAPIGGTWIADLSRSVLAGSAPGCGVCPAEERQSDNAVAKLSVFLNSDRLGSHDLMVGIDLLEDSVEVESGQSGSGLSIWSYEPFAFRDRTVFPRFSPRGGNRLQWNPLLDDSTSTETSSEAYFLTDRWKLNDHWSFNLGLRYERDQAIGAFGSTIADHDSWSPRIGATYDLRADDTWILNASFGRYVTGVRRLLDAPLAASTGATAELHWLYDGPTLTGELETDDALLTILSWFDRIGSVGNIDRLSQIEVPGITVRLAPEVEPPSVDEVTLGVSARLGDLGSVRADFVHREFGDFYVLRTDPETGRVLTPFGLETDLALIDNADGLLERRYDGLNSQLRLRLWDRLRLAAAWTWSHTRGRESAAGLGGRDFASEIGRYPELKAFDRHNPRGDLDVDIRHKARIWGIWSATDNLEVSLLHAFETGRPYAAVGAVESRAFVDLDALGYAFPPPTVAYYFTARDAFRTDDIHSTNLAVNFTHQLGPVEFLVQADVINVFDRRGVRRVDSAVLDATNSDLAPFNPFTDTPVEGVHWARSAEFGQPVRETDYQTPRTLRLSLAIRF